MPPSHLSLLSLTKLERYLSLAEREQIALLRARDEGVREIARQLERSPSTVSRELRRNAATRGGGFEYRATAAQWHADRAARRPKRAKLVTNADLRRYVQDRLSGKVVTPSGKPIAGPRGSLERAAPWTKATPAMVARVESGANFSSSADPLSR